MAWIESHQSLATHRKLYKLMALLHIERPTAIGVLHLLWWWSIDNTKKGMLKGIGAPEIAHVVDWQGEPVVLVDALLSSGFLELHTKHGKQRANLQIRNWHRYIGRLLEARAAHAERMRQARAKHVSGTRASRAPEPTVTNRNQPTDLSIARITTACEERFRLALTPNQAAQLMALADEYTEADILDAIDEAANSGHPNLGYVHGILRAWAAQGKKTRAGQREGGNRGKARGALTNEETARYAIANWEECGFASEAAARKHFAEVLGG